MVVSYSHKPSHGIGCTDSCPDTEKEIKSICREVLGGKLIWDGAESFHTEGDHRAMRYKYSDGYDLILTIDADEVFKEDEIHSALVFASLGRERYYGINGYVNLWRSFNWACYDGFRPIRIENLRANNNEQNLNCNLTVWHFSTCQSEKVMRYKFNVFGHASEVRPNWVQETYYGWTPQNNFPDVHCVAYGLWTPTPYDKNKMPNSLKNHVNFNKELI